jgi:hypothetical protein
MDGTQDETQELTYYDEIRTGWAVRVFRVLARSRLGRRVIYSIFRSALGGMR